MDKALNASYHAALIACAWRRTALGPMLMASTGGGVCALHFADQPQQLIPLLRARFPHARLTETSPTAAPFDEWMDALAAYFSYASELPQLPLDLHGTAFQQRVWRFLRTTRAGQVITYGTLAGGIGKPTAVRAAASACAANPVAVLVPCHRVLRADGGLGGYRWGLERKRKLLATEHGLAAAPSVGASRVVDAILTPQQHAPQ